MNNKKTFRFKAVDFRNKSVVCYWHQSGINNAIKFRRAMFMLRFNRIKCLRAVKFQPENVNLISLLVNYAK